MDNEMDWYVINTFYSKSFNVANQLLELERWRVKFQNSFDIPNDEWEEVLDWSSRSVLTTIDYLRWLYDGMISGYSLSRMLFELE